MLCRVDRRSAIGQGRTAGFATPLSTRAAPRMPSGYTRKSDAIFGGDGASSTAFSSAFGTGQLTPGPWAQGTMDTILPSGYSLNRKPSALGESWGFGQSDASRFHLSAPPPPLYTSRQIAPTKVSSYTRSVAAGSPFASAGAVALHPTQARLHALAAPYDIDPHAHKRRGL